jgi:hypothetical protein
MDVAVVDTGPWQPDPPPPWVPPPGVDGEPGWRDSTVPVCSPFIGKPTRAMVWADSRGVYLVAGVSNNPFADYGFPNGWTVQLNTGTGWNEVLRLSLETTFEEGPSSLAGFDGAPIWLFGRSCAVRAVDVGETSCILPGPLSGDLSFYKYFRYASDAMIVVETTVPGPWQVRRFVEGGEPETLEEQYSAHVQGLSELWSDGEVIVFASTGGIRVRDAAGVVSLVASVPAPLAWPREIRGPADVWYSDDDSAGTLGHFNGESWATVELPAPACDDQFSDAVREVFSGPAGTWILRERSLYRWSSGTLSTVLDWGCGHPQTLDTIHGSSSINEVYLVLQDPGFEAYACGGSFILWSDGVTTRRF